MEKEIIFSSKPKVLFVCKDRSEYGKTYGLTNSASFVSHWLNDQGVRSHVAMVSDNNGIDKVVTEYNPTHVFIEALWVTPEKIAELLAIQRHKKRIWVVRLHSRPVFLALEGIAFTWLLGYKKLGLKQLYIAPNTKEFTDDLVRYGLKTAYLPNIYYPEPTDNMCPKKPFDGHSIDIGCFGAIRPMKNHMTQAIAAIEFAQREGLRLNFHVNQRMEQGGETIMKNLRALFDNYKNYYLVEHDWHSHVEFMDLIRNTHLGMQVSLTETFNIVAADYVAAGVGIVGSPQVTWLPEIFQADPNSTDSIRGKLAFAWGWLGQSLKCMSERALLHSSKAAEKEWSRFLCLSNT